MQKEEMEFDLTLNDKQFRQALDSIANASEKMNDLLGGLGDTLDSIHGALGKTAQSFDTVKSSQGDAMKSIIEFQTSINALQPMVATAIGGMGKKISKELTDIFGDDFFKGIALPIAGAVLAMGALSAPVIALAVNQDDLTISIENLDAASAGLGGKFVEVAQYAADFYSGIDSSKGILDGFNVSISEAASQQRELALDVRSTQTEIADSIHALAETEGGYTEEQVANIEGLFSTLHEKADAELQSQTALQDIVKQRAEDSIALGTLNEEQAQKLIKSAADTKEAVQKTAEDQYNNELALLYEKYSAMGNLDDENYEKERKEALKVYNTAIEEAQKKENDTLGIITQGYADQSDAYQEFKENYTTFTQEMDAADQEHSDRLAETMESQHDILNQGFRNQYSITSEIGGSIRTATAENTQAQADAMNKLSGSMDEETGKQLGFMLTMLGNTQMKGKDIDDETSKFIDSLIDTFEKLPDDTKDAMKNVMQPMLNTMQEKEPSLFEKATGIATGILTRLKKAFNIQSPSKEVKKIFLNVMKGAEQGLEEEKPDLLDQAANIADSVLDKLDMEQKKIPALKLTAELDEAHLHEQAKDAVAALVAKMAAAVWLQSGSLFARIGAAANYQAGGQPAGVTNNVGGDTYILNQPVATPGELFRAAKIRRKEAAYE